MKTTRERYFSEAAEREQNGVPLRLESGAHRVASLLGGCNFEGAMGGQPNYSRFISRQFHKMTLQSRTVRGDSERDRCMDCPSAVVTVEVLGELELQLSPLRYVRNTM